MRSSLPTVLAVLAALTFATYLALGLGGAPAEGPTELPIARGVVDHSIAEPIQTSPVRGGKARTATVVPENRSEPAPAALSRPAGVSLLVTTSWGSAPGGASSVVVEGEEIGTRVIEVRQKQALFEELPAGSWINVRWMSGREHTFRGLLHEELVQLPTAGQRNLNLSVDQANGNVGHVRLSVLTPPEVDGSELHFSIRRETEEPYQTSLRAAPWSVPAFGEARADLWRLAPGRWTVQSGGLGTVGEFTIDSDQWTDAVVDLRGLAVVRVHVLQAISGQPLRSAQVSWSGGGASNWSVAEGLGAEFGHTHQAWILPGKARIRATAGAASSGMVHFDVLPGSNELILDVESRIELKHEIVLANNGDFQPVGLEAWVGGEFQTLEGTGEVESIQFQVLEGQEKPMAHSAMIVVSAEGRYRWFLPEELDPGLGMIEFSVNATDVTATTVEVGAWHGWLTEKDS